MLIKNIRERLHFAQFCVLHRRALTVQNRWQEKHLQRIVQHAYQHVPLWRTLLNRKGIDPSSIRTLEDFSVLPVTSKQTFLGRMVEEYIDNHRVLNSAWYVTSGTSGTPFRFLMKEQARVRKYADFASFRFLWWRGESIKSALSARVAYIRVRGSSDDRHLFVPVEEFLRDPRGVLTTIEQFKADIIATYPSILFDIARLLSRDPSLPRPTPRFLLSFGEMLEPSVRRLATEVLGGEVYDRYGLEEIGVVGIECSMHGGFHVNTESVFVEILEDGRDVVVCPNAAGRIIVTDLFNYGMPFIRYDTGDRGKISYEPCACGLRSPRLWIEGRYSAYISLRGRRMHHLEFDAAMDGFMDRVFQYQIAKKTDGEILARIIPGPGFHSGVLETVRESLLKLVGDGVRVGVEAVERLPMTPRGKSRILVDESFSPAS